MIDYFPDIGPMSIDAYKVLNDLQVFIGHLDELPIEKQKELAHKLYLIYDRRPQHKPWLQKLHELLDIE